MFGGDKTFFTKKKEKPVTDETKAETLAEKNERRRLAGEASMRKYVEADRQEMVDARAYKPVVSIADYPSGKFFCVDDREWPLRYVESIEVEYAGREPYWQYVSSSVRAPFDAERASIKVTMHSGQSHYIECNRHQLDPLLDAMKTAWKQGRSVGVDSA